VGPVVLVCPRIAAFVRGHFLLDRRRIAASLRDRSVPGLHLRSLLSAWMHGHLSHLVPQASG
jgi:hypothetical protein